MNDDELITRLRRTLHERAEGIEPRPGQLPVGGRAPYLEAAGGRTAADRPDGHDLGADGMTGRGPATWHGPATGYGPHPPTGPLPLLSRVRRRWPPVVGAVAVVAAAAAALTTVMLTGGKHPVTVQPAGPTPTVEQPVPTTTPQAAPSSLPPISTAPPAPPAVPAGFQPYSVTFVSALDGWAVGWAPCPSTPSALCAALVTTADGGRTWGRTGAPPITAPAPHTGAAGDYPYFEVRFADQRDGWIYTAPGASTPPSTLWATHDGAATWHELPLPLAGANIGGLEAAGGQAQMALYGPCPPGTAGCQGQTVEEVWSTPVGRDAWTPSPVQPSVGAGPVLSPQLTLWGSSGWLLNDNRTTVSGARLTAGSGWAPWTPACSTANGGGLLAAWSTRDLVAVCAEGAWGTPDAGTVPGHSWLFRSGDLGATFKPVGQVPGNQPRSVTVPPAGGQTVVVADAQEGLVGSFDGGRTWATLQPGMGTGGGAGGRLFGYVGFTSASQGVAVAYLPVPALFMTRDGGHTWSQVRF